MQPTTNLLHFIARAQWSAKEASDYSQEYVTEHLISRNRILTIDETGLLKIEGEKSIDVNRPLRTTRVEFHTLNLFPTLPFLSAGLRISGDRRLGCVVVDCNFSPSLQNVFWNQNAFQSYIGKSFMAASTSIFSDKLHEYPKQDVIDGTGGESASILEDCLNENDGVLQLIHRYAGRTFCTPGKRLRLDAKSYYPDYMNGTGLDELWMCCTVPIVTGVIDTRTSKAPFREGEAHVLTPTGQVISLQDLITANPEAVMGEKVTAFAKSLFDDPTWPIVSKKFDNLNPIPHHLHWSKWEVYDINSFDNPGVSPSHYHTTAMGLYPFVTKDQFLACMKRFGKGEYNGVRHLSPHTMMHIDNGFVMPNGVLHSPTDLCTHELHVTMDEHFLAEDLTLDGRIGAADAFYACREEDYPKDKHEDWEYLVETFDFEANQDPDFVLKNSRPAITAEEFSGDGVDAKWIVYGDFLGDQKCSILRLTVHPGIKTTFCPETPALFHTNGGRGRVGKLEVQYHQDMVLGELYPEIGFITQSALNNGGVEIENSGTEPLVLTFDFPQNAHSTTPGTN